MSYLQRIIGMTGGSVYFLHSLYHTTNVRKKDIHVTGLYSEPSIWCDRYYLTDAAGQTYRVARHDQWVSYRVGETYSVETYGFVMDGVLPRIR
jgi:hypothetical protein